MRGDSAHWPKMRTLTRMLREYSVEFLRTACEGAAYDRHETACDMRIDQGNGLSPGFCPDLMDAGFVDAGAPPCNGRGDSTVGMEAGTSTVGMDAGTSTTGVDAGTDAGI